MGNSLSLSTGNRAGGNQEPLPGRKSRLRVSWTFSLTSGKGDCHQIYGQLREKATSTGALTHPASKSPSLPQTAWTRLSGCIKEYKTQLPADTGNFTPGDIPNSYTNSTWRECSVKNGFPALQEQTYLRKARGCCKPAVPELNLSQVWFLFLVNHFHGLCTFGFQPDWKQQTLEGSESFPKCEHPPTPRSWRRFNALQVCMQTARG